MLVRYEYEVLSFIALNGISKINGDIIISLKRINDELGKDIDSYLRILDYKNLINLTEDKIIINAESWVNFFIDELERTFSYNGINVVCEKKVIDTDNFKQFHVEFKLNGSSKLFRLILNKNGINKQDKEELIFMCTTNAYEDRIYWLELLNDVNLLNMFHSYLINEINYINKFIYRSIDIFDGIDEKHISEIFNVSIKNYFTKKGKEIVDFNKKQAEFIYELVCSENICYYGVNFNCGVLWVIKNKNKIIFLCIKDRELVYSDIIDGEILLLHKKVVAKVSEYKELIMFKENNTLDNLIKIISKVSVFFVPTSLIISILGILNLNVINFKNYKLVLIAMIIILILIQILIISFIYVPTIKMSKFKWKI